MPDKHQNTIQCQICKLNKDLNEVVKGELVREKVIETIKKSYPNWDSSKYICVHDLDLFRSQYIKDVLQAEKTELSDLEEEVLKSIRENEILSRNLNNEIKEELKLGDKIADKVAAVGGSWKFIIAFAIIICLWITTNSLQLFFKPFDPFPFILLNLVLSFMAGFQAPIIMMSQNRQSQKDRLQAEHDYKVNLKAELEIRHLNEKVDHLLIHQWSKLMEIQQVQIELMTEILEKTAIKTEDKP